MQLIEIEADKRYILPEIEVIFDRNPQNRMLITLFSNLLYYKENNYLVLSFNKYVIILTTNFTTHLR